MHDSTSAVTRRRVPRSRPVLVAVLVLSFFAATAAEAGATLGIVNHNDPAGDPTAITYRLLAPPDTAPYVPDWTLGDGVDKSFGVKPGTYTFQALPPAGWQVASIQCVGRGRPGEFAIDVPNGRVTAVHQAGDEQYCSFTNHRTSAASGPTSAGVSPVVPTNKLPEVTLPTGPVLLRVRGDRGFASAVLRLTRQSVVKAQLLKGKKVVGTTRVIKKAGTHTVKVSLAKKYRRSYLRQGLKRVTLTLKVVVVGSNRFTKVFRFGVVVRL
jgi:hypothetical protein